MTDWRSSLRADPTPWLLEHACPPIRYRVLSELLELPPDDPDVRAARQEAFAYKPAVQLAKKQRKDGTWGGKIHAGDGRGAELCTENAMSHLFEYGWYRDTRVVREAAKLLRTYLSQKRDVDFYEFKRVVKADERREQFYRWFLRILALGLLTRAGYQEERSRMLVLQILDYTASFVEDPVARNPVEDIGASHPLLRFQAWREGYIFIPDRYLTQVFAFSPWLLDGELAKMRLKKIYDYVMSATYQELAPDLGLVRTAKGAFLKGHGMRFPTLEEVEKAGALDELLGQMELMARLGLINRYPLLMSQLDWLHGQQDKDGRWNFPTKLIHDQSRWTRLMRLEKDWRSPARKEADLTFRVLLIFKYQWERQMRMLDRRDNGYPF